MVKIGSILSTSIVRADIMVLDKKLAVESLHQTFCEYVEKWLEHFTLARSVASIGISSEFCTMDFLRWLEYNPHSKVPNIITNGQWK